jgi:hypothetical protein
MGVVWSASRPGSPERGGTQTAEIHAGHFAIGSRPEGNTTALASANLPLPAWLGASLLQFKKDLR